MTTDESSTLSPSLRSLYVNAVADALVTMQTYFSNETWNTLHVMSNTTGRERKDCARVIGLLFWNYTLSTDNPNMANHIYSTVLDKLRWSLLEGLQEGYSLLYALVHRLTHHSIVHKVVETALNNNSKFQIYPAKHLTFVEALPIVLQEFIDEESKGH